MWTHFSLETMDTPNSGKKCSVIKYFFIFWHCFPKWVYQMNVLFPSLPCPQPHHLYTHRPNVSGGNRERDRKRKQGPPWEHPSTALNCILNAEVTGSYHRSQGNKRLCGSAGEGEWDSIPQQRPTRIIWGGVQQSDPEASRVGSNTPAHDSLQWDRVIQLKQWPRKEEPWLCGYFPRHSISLVSYRLLEWLMFLRFVTAYQK